MKQEVLEKAALSLGSVFRPSRKPEIVLAIQRAHVSIVGHPATLQEIGKVVGSGAAVMSRTVSKLVEAGELEKRLEPSGRPLYWPVGKTLVEVFTT